jgi:UDP-N-acetylglucosamine:LPS N-acetylglucosamine transferase
MVPISMPARSDRSPKIMIISRGHGFGHAMPDMAMGKLLKMKMPALELIYVSYASGAEAYRANGYDVLDLEAPEFPPLLDMIVLLSRVFDKYRPDLVLAHEEFAAVPAASSFDIPALFITDYFLDPTSMLMRALQYAEEILFIGEPGLFTEPPHLRNKISYVGRAVRECNYTRDDRAKIRQEMGIAEPTFTVLCQPGAWTESEVMLSDLVNRAWNAVQDSSKVLIWIAGRDFECLSERFKDRSDFIILKQDWNLGRLMAASDVLITKANRMTVYEAASLGLPSISLSNLVNWPDDVAIAKVASNTALQIDATVPEDLAKVMITKANENPTPATKISGGISRTVEKVLEHITMRTGC